MTNFLYQEERLVSHNNLTRFNWTQIPPCFQEWCLGLKFPKDIEKMIAIIYTVALWMLAHFPQIWSTTQHTVFSYLFWMKPTRLVEHVGELYTTRVVWQNYINIYLHSKVYISALGQFSFECRKVIGFAFTALRNWLKKLTTLFHPIRRKTKTNHDSLIRVFPHFASATCNYCVFWLVHLIICVLCDWLEWLLWFWFYDTQLKTTLVFFRCLSLNHYLCNRTQDDEYSKKELL